jgi:dihydrolipoyl dehydrogenase
MAERFDLTVIGSGPGGYVCAIRAAQLGMKVAVIEKRATHGGTCLNIGCIPSKALLHATELFEEAGHNFTRLGIDIGTPRLNLPAMMRHKSDTVAANTGGIEFLFKKNRITAFQGRATIKGKGEIAVERVAGGGTQTVLSKNIVIATGSEATPLPGVEADEKRIVTSTGALELSKVPQNLLIVGAGVIGLELGSVWSRLGARVTVVEFLDHILPGTDSEVARQFQRLLKRQGFAFKLSTKVTAIDASGEQLEVSIQPARGGDTEVLATDIALIAIGRRPYTKGLGLEEAGVVINQRSQVVVDGQYRTNVDGIYAIGDVIAGPMLAHKAADEGIALAEILAGQAGHVNYAVIPGVVYTQPEIATLGKTEDELKAEGVAYKVSKFPFTANGRAKSMVATEGFVKILADKATDRVLGAHIISRSAGEIIHELAVLMEFGGSAEDLARTCHAHPTLSEAIREAALGAGSGAIHM